MSVPSGIAGTYRPLQGPTGTPQSSRTVIQIPSTPSTPGQEEDGEDVSLRRCWYCKGPAIPDHLNNLTLHRFCSCGEPTGQGNVAQGNVSQNVVRQIRRKWVHMHCITWHIMETLDAPCPSCRMRYKNYRMRRLNRGSRDYYWQETYLERLSIFNYTFDRIRWPVPFFIRLFLIFVQITDMYDAINIFLIGIAYKQIGEELILEKGIFWSNPFRIIKDLIVHGKLKQLLAYISFWTNTIKIPRIPFELIYNKWNSWSKMVGKYIIFNKHILHGQNRKNDLIAYHYTESMLMRKMKRMKTDHRLTEWFIRQIGDQGVKYQELEQIEKTADNPIELRSIYHFMYSWTQKYGND